MKQEHHHYLQKRHYYQCSKESLFESSVKILNSYGAWMNALTKGLINPLSQGQERFISMHEGDFLPLTSYEYAWFDYRTTCLYLDLINDEKNISGWTIKNPEHCFYKLACVGHYLSRKWLEDKGINWHPIAKPFNLGGFTKRSHELIRSSDNNKYIYFSSGNSHTGYSPHTSDPNSEPESADWSDRYDDITSEGWNIICSD